MSHLRRIFSRMNPVDPITRLNAALEGRYRIERQLGEGGMATVYLADDLRHERRVALKVLKPELAEIVGAERFLAEIKTTANLQHPHILALHDSGEADGLLFYVMPFVEGESLRDRLDREHQLPVDDAVRIATNVAEALDYAHRRGVIHRDVKPENILLQDGKPVVSDFGIALAVSAGGGDRLTRTGFTQGTPLYMSPEQATGEQRVGPAADVYSLGCVLYELLVGEPPFTGSTPQVVLGRKASGTWTAASAARPSIPPHVDAVIRRALEPTPADRFPSGAGLSVALADPGFRYGGVPEPAPHRPSLTTIAGVGVLALVAGLLIGRAFPSEERASGPVIRYQPVFRYDERPSPTAGATLDLSDDGERLVYVGGSGGGNQLFVRYRNELVSRPIPNTEGAAHPAISPDGSRVAFVTDAAGLRTIGLDGSQPLTLVDEGVESFDLSWGSDGYVYFDDVDSPGLMRVLAAGGSAPEAVYRGDPDPDVVFHGAAQALPGGEAVLVNVVHNWGRDAVAVIETATGSMTRLVDGYRGRYVQTGHLVYVDPEGTLTAQAFDATRLALSGDPVALRELGEGFLDLAVSGDGRMVYSRVPPRENRVVWVDRDGGETRLDDGNPITGSRFLSLAPDGTRLAVSTDDEPGRDLGQVWVKELPRGPYTLLTHDGDVNFRPAWDPDHESLLFVSNRSGNRAVWRRRADGSGEAERILERHLPVDEVELTADGTWMVYREGSQNGERAIRARRVGYEASDVAIAGGRFDAFAPAVSPDGSLVAYASRVNGETDVYVRPFPTGEGQWRISRNGGSGPRWASGGRELFFMGANDSLNVVEVAGDRGTLRFSEPRGLFSTRPYRTETYHASYDVSADGSRFAMIRLRSQEVESQEIVVVENFLSELAAAKAR